MATTFGQGNAGFQVAHSSAPIHAEFHLAAERAETPPKPSYLLPFRRDPGFVERKHLLEQIQKRLDLPAARVALVGFGGVGKSQLAIEYAYRLRERSPRTWVLWIDASNAARFEQSVRDIADLVKIPGRKEIRANVFRLLRNWLRDEAKGKWLLILDSADDTSFLFQPASIDESLPDGEYQRPSRPPLLDYLPVCDHGSILVTTRSKQAIRRFIDDVDTIPVSPMDNEDAVKLLETKLDRHVSSRRADLVELATSLECIPLALAQAAAYVRQRAPACSVRQYIEKLGESDESKAALLDLPAESSRRGYDAKNSISLTWQISFDHMRQIHPSAAQLLSLMSFFDRQAIPEDLLRHRTYAPAPRNDERPQGTRSHEPFAGTGQNLGETEAYPPTLLSTAESFDRDINVLRDYSFITITPGESTYGMHRLVQLATWRWLSKQGQLEAWKEEFIGILDKAFPDVEYGNWAICQALFPHTKSAMKLKPLPDRHTALVQWAAIMHNAACFALERGDLTVAEEMTTLSLETRIHELGPQHKQTLRAMSTTGEVLGEFGRWQEAEKMLRNLIETCNQSLGSDDVIALRSTNLLASALGYQRQFKESRDLALQSAERCIRALETLGDSSPAILRHLEIRILETENEEQREKAEQFYLRLLGPQNNILGEAHPVTLKNTHRLSVLYFCQGRVMDAQRLLLPVTKAMTNVLGREHPTTLIAAHDLARVFQHSGRTRDVEPLIKRVIYNAQRTFGPGSPRVLGAEVELGAFWGSRGQFSEAEQLLKRAVDKYTAAFGPEHPKTLETLAALALMYSRLGHWKEAETLLDQVIEKQERALDKGDERLLECMAQLATTYSAQSRYGEAEHLLLQVLDAHQTALRPDFTGAWQCRHELAVLYNSQGRQTESEQLLLEVIAGMRRVFGESHWQTQGSIKNLINVYRNQRRWEDARVLLLPLIKAQNLSIGAEHPETLQTMHWLASIYVRQRNLDEAEELLEQVLETRIRVLGHEHPDTSETRTLLSSLNPTNRAPKTKPQLWRRLFKGPRSPQV